MFGAVLVAGGLIVRFAAAWPAVVASVMSVAALGSLAVGLVINGRHHGVQWRRGWSLLALALVLLTLGTIGSAFVGPRGGVAAFLECVEVVSAALAAAGVVRLLGSRVAHRSGDVLLEGSIIAAACTYVAWAWTAAQGMGHVSTALALVPVFPWVLVVWLTGRLLFLTPEQIAGYRILGAGFATLLFTDVILVGARFGGGSVDRRELIGFTLCACCLWGIAALHPSMRQTFAPAEIAPAKFGAVKLGAHLAVAIVAPVSLLLLPTTRESPGITTLVAASGLLPLLLVGYLARQIRGRARAEYRAQHDELTGLPNRRLFQDRAEAAFSDARRNDSKVAVLFLDLDRFKAINDSLGHTIGNQLLQGVAKRLRAIVRETDTVARFGGDEFTVIVGDVDSDDDVAELARGILDGFARPFGAGGRELHTRASIGVAFFPDDGTDIDTLLKGADIAMYRAKARGGDAFEFYTPGLAIRAQTKLSVESGLRQALDRGTLELHYQPQVDVQTGRMFGLEALARWPHPTIGMIPPDVFVPVAEESNLVVALGEWALEEACAQARRWLDDGIEARTIAVNISARHFSTDEFVGTVRGVLGRHSIPHGVLEIEITESIFMRDLERASVALADLREMGVRCSIDDFGTGFSGLRYLADMSLDSLKIDQSFVSNVRQERDDSPVIDAIIGLGQRLDLDVVAEGVETQEQLAFLVAQGCTRMQGYLFGRPSPAGEIERVLRSDDNAEIDWFAAIKEVVDLTTARVTALPLTQSSGLLSAICSSPDNPLDVDTSALPGLLEALASDGRETETSGAVLKMSLRVAAGTCAGLVPLVGSLAAADALPNPVQSVVAATAQTVGIELPHQVRAAQRKPAAVVAARLPAPPPPPIAASGNPPAEPVRNVAAAASIPSTPSSATTAASTPSTRKAKKAKISPSPKAVERDRADKQRDPRHDNRNTRTGRGSTRSVARPDTAMRRTPAHNTAAKAKNRRNFQSTRRRRGR